MKVQCLHPYVIKLPQEATPENPFPELRLPCGKCAVCRARSQKEWAFRLQIEKDYSDNCFFITFTYNEKNCPRVGNTAVLAYRDIQLMFKRLRRFFERKGFSPKGMRYFYCGEYGPRTLRPHYHCILFNVPCVRLLQTALLSSWKKGFIMVDPVNDNRISYVSKYCTFDSMLPSLQASKEYRPRRIMSRRPGIGYQYLTPSKYRFYNETLQTYIRYKGICFPMPRFIYDRLFDCQEVRDQISSMKRSFIESQLEDYTKTFAEEDRFRIARGQPTVYEECVEEFLSKVDRDYNYHKNKKNRI